MKRYLKELFMFSVAVAVWGCNWVNDDTAQCDRVQIQLEYLADGQQNVIGQYMDRADLYLFDSQNHWVRTFQFDAQQLATSPATQLFRLDDGVYRAVAVGNLHERTAVAIPDAVDLEQMLLSANNVDMPSGIDGIYLGMTEFTVAHDKTTVVPVRLMTAHTNLYVELRGVSATDVPLAKSVTSLYRIVLDQASPSVNFRGKPTGVPLVFYPNERIDAANYLQHTVDCNLPLLTEENLPILKIIDRSTGQVLFTKDLLEFVQEHPEIDIHLQEMTLAVVVEFTPVGVVVKLPEWYIRPVDPEI